MFVALSCSDLTSTTGQLKKNSFSPVQINCMKYFNCCTIACTDISVLIAFVGFLSNEMLFIPFNVLFVKSQTRYGNEPLWTSTRWWWLCFSSSSGMVLAFCLVHKKAAFSDVTSFSFPFCCSLKRAESKAWCYEWLLPRILGSTSCAMRMTIVD